MSHITKIATKMNDIDCIKEALDVNNYTHVDGGVAKTFRGTTNGDLIVKRDGNAYDIAFVKEENGNYTVKADWWRSDITEAEFVTQIKQSYAASKIAKEVKKNPSLRMIKKEELANGTQRIRISTMGWYLKMKRRMTWLIM